MNTRDQMQWNLGGWLGGQLGGSAWMLVAGLLSIRLDAVAGVTVLGIFAAANLIGWGLWRRRDRLSALAGIQILLSVLGIFGLAAVFVLDRASVYEANQSGQTVSASASYGVLILIVGGLMVLFNFRYGRSSKSVDDAA